MNQFRGEAKLVLLDKDGNQKDSRGFNNLVTNAGLEFFAKMYFNQNDTKIDRIALGTGDITATPKSPTMTSLRNFLCAGTIVAFPSWNDVSVSSEGDSLAANYSNPVTCYAVFADKDRKLPQTSKIFTAFRELYPEATAAIFTNYSNTSIVTTSEIVSLGIQHPQLTSLSMLNALNTTPHIWDIVPQISGVDITELGLLGADDTLISVLDINPPITKLETDCLIVTWTLKGDEIFHSINPFYFNRDVIWYKAGTGSEAFIDGILGRLFSPENFHYNFPYVGLAYNNLISDVPLKVVTDAEYTFSVINQSDYIPPDQSLVSTGHSIGSWGASKFGIENDNVLLAKIKFSLSKDETNGIIGGFGLGLAPLAIDYELLFQKLFLRFNQTIETIGNPLFVLNFTPPPATITNSNGDVIPNFVGLKDAFKTFILALPEGDRDEFIRKVIFDTVSHIPVQHKQYFSAGEPSIYSANITKAEMLTHFVTYGYNIKFLDPVNGVSPYKGKILNITMNNYFGRTLYPNLTPAQKAEV